MKIKRLSQSIAVIFLAGLLSNALAQRPVVENKNHESMLASEKSELAVNKRLVYDMWRVLLEAGQYNQAEKYLTSNYVDHNAIVPPGRDAFVEYLKRRPQKEIQKRVETKITSITAERDRVIINFVRELENPKEPGKFYTTSGFDMYRIENGKIAEHWDAIELGRTTTHIK